MDSSIVDNVIPEFASWKAVIFTAVGVVILWGRWQQTARLRAVGLSSFFTIWVFQEGGSSSLSS